jgi:hypothetical protein
MSITVCIAPAKTLEYPEGGGHLWEYLNWALGLCAGLPGNLVRSDNSTTSADACTNVAALKRVWALSACELCGLFSLISEALPI